MDAQTLDMPQAEELHFFSVELCEYRSEIVCVMRLRLSPSLSLSGNLSLRIVFP
ncbi:MAG: hypothetical protein QM516_00750 [Limnohabitans sp.]|nr:hypothetical protein [Limnohabitans sp.]